jgi:SAM-dependent methyltransferase
MNRADVEHYKCAACCGCFRIMDGCDRSRNDNVTEGMLTCRSCGLQHPIINSIPRFIPAENYAGSFGYQWKIHRKTQLDSYTGFPISKHRLFAVTQWPDKLDGQRILEAGSGAGRFTEVLLQAGADVFSFDCSAAVEANLLNNGEKPNLHLFQGDIFNIPFAEESFDKVVCLGVLQHTPDPEKAFMSLAKYVRRGGDLVIDVYPADVVSYLQWKYVLRPITKRMDKERLYKIVLAITPHLVTVAVAMRRLAGRVGARLIPIVEYSHLNLQPEVNDEWAILDTFDMYSPAHDHPQTRSTVNRWFLSAEFTDVDVRRGPNGIVGRGRKPISIDKASL